jgi:hypothetical protein
MLLPPRFVILLLFAVVVPALSQSKRSFWVKWQFNYLRAEFDHLIIGKQDRVKANAWCREGVSFFILLFLLRFLIYFFPNATFFTPFSFLCFHYFWIVINSLH